MTNKKLNNEYESLNKDFSLLKNEKEKMKQEMEQQNAKIFNYQKELSKNINNNKKDLDINFNNINDENGKESNILLQRIINEGKSNNIEDIDLISLFYKVFVLIIYQLVFPSLSQKSKIFKFLKFS